MTNNSPQEVYDILSSCTKPICLMDSRFDFDSLCSTLAFRTILKNYFKKELKLTAPYDKMPESVKNLGFDTSDIQLGVNPNTVDLSQYDLVVFLDSGDLPHISSDSSFSLKYAVDTLNIDHHSTNDGYGKYNYVQALGSTCTVVKELLDTWKIDISTDIDLMRTLATGIMTDTGFLSFESVTPKDYRTIADFRERGVIIYDIVWKLSFNDTFSDYKLKELIYANLVVNKEKRYAYSLLPTQDLEKRGIDLQTTGVVPADTIKRLQGIDFAFVIKEVPNSPGIFGVSFRSHDPKYDVSALAKLFGGGGHKMAAAGKVSGMDNIKEALEYVESKISQYGA